jgi:hypothetical protein
MAFFALRQASAPGKPPVEKLERFVKFKPQTPLREIIRLTATFTAEKTRE